MHFLNQLCQFPRILSRYIPSQPAGRTEGRTQIPGSKLRVHSEVVVTNPLLDQTPKPGWTLHKTQPKETDLSSHCTIQFTGIWNNHNKMHFLQNLEKGFESALAVGIL